jgi:vacuolar-type H+-ATPase subunit F/Vma7
MDSYSSLWEKVFQKIVLANEVRKIGFGNNKETEMVRIVDKFGKNISPDAVRNVLSILSTQFLPILIIDEFDRVKDEDVRTAIADTIKTLSDNAISATVVLVGVADSVNDLIREHQSVERALVQIPIPRMSNQELNEIIENGLEILGMSIEEKAKNEIALLSQGLPHYTHLLGLHATREALDKETKVIRIDHVNTAIRGALAQAQQTIRSAYHKATTSTRRNSIYSHVLLACALAPTDGMGYFAAGDIRIPLNEIMGKTYDIPSFSRHLYEFCEPAKRGAILQKTGSPHRYKFRFVNPLMQPYIVMQGLATALIDAQKLENIKQKS